MHDLIIDKGMVLFEASRITKEWSFLTVTPVELGARHQNTKTRKDGHGNSFFLQAGQGIHSGPALVTPVVCTESVLVTAAPREFL